MMLLSDASLLFFVPMAIEESETSKRHLNVSDHTLRGYLMHSQRMARETSDISLSLTARYATI